MSIRITKDDFTVALIGEDECGGEGSGCLGRATHSIRMDLRAMGGAQEVFRGCEPCCNEIHAAIVEGLPEYGPADEREEGK